nr:fibronectin type III domain-containing protein [Gemmatimonadota bacterium]
MPLTRRSLIHAIAMIALYSAACSDSNTGPSAPDPIVGLSTTAKGSSSVQLSFNSRAGDTSYDIERAEGAAGAFAQITNIVAPATPGAVTHVDAGLKVNTIYRYRVITNRDGLRSIPSGEASTTTLTFGNAAADIAADITASRTLYADTVYTLKGFIHVANGATLTIQPGTTIKGDFATVGSSLWILRGARIQA